jgi:endonuclease/exonuclease/phosphatase family metal-dependent hydrolase
MKIYSWNILCRNRELDRAFDFISKSDFDIFCLQEVPEEFLKRLQTLPYHIAFRSERELLYPCGPVHNYVVTLSKDEIVSQGEILFPEYWHFLPLRTRLFVMLMPNQLFTKIRNRSALYVDVKTDKQSLRIFNLHLILAQPAWRLKEFEMAMAERDPSRPSIVCGDFNTIEAPHISILNWILGGKVSDAFFHRRERTDINKRFVQHELVNTLAGSITHQLSRSQLDHILVSRSFSIKDAEVLSDRIGSDHHPIFVEVE